MKAAPCRPMAVEAAATVVGARARMEAAKSIEAESGQAAREKEAAVRQWSVAVQR